jgi:hypothetical protein
MRIAAVKREYRVPNVAQMRCDFVGYMAFDRALGMPSRSLFVIRS